MSRVSQAPGQLAPELLAVQTVPAAQPPQFAPKRSFVGPILNAILPIASAVPPYLTNITSGPADILNVIFPIELVVESSSAHEFAPAQTSQPFDAVKSQSSAVLPGVPSSSHPNDVQTGQLGGVPAALLTAMHAKPAVQKNNEAACGTTARLPRTQLHDQSPTRYAGSPLVCRLCLLC